VDEYPGHTKNGSWKNSDVRSVLKWAEQLQDLRAKPKQELRVEELPDGGAKTQDMLLHPEWHPELCCGKADHWEASPNLKVDVTVPAVWNETLQLRHPYNRELKVSAVSTTMLTRLASINENKKLGGALFSNPRYWTRIMPNTRSARWQLLGGVDWPLRERRQQTWQQVRVPDLNDEALHTATKLQEFVEQGVYEKVKETEEEEEESRQEVRTGEWRMKMKKAAKSLKFEAAAVKNELDQKTELTKAQKQSQQLLKKTMSTLEQKARKRLKKLSQERAIDEVQERLNAQIFYSEVYTIPKPESDRRRMLQNLKASKANKHVRLRHKHKQDGVRDLRGMVRPGDRFLSLDLHEAFHQVTVQERLRAMLRVRAWVREPQGVVLRRLQNTTLSQGLCASPELMTKLLADVLRLFRILGIRVRIKIDDIILVVSSVKEGMMVGWVVSTVMTRLGAVFSKAKCNFALSTRAHWCGMVVCSIAQVTSLPAAKVTKVVDLMKGFAAQMQDVNAKITLRRIQQITGVLIASIDAMDAARLMTLEVRHMRRYIVQHMLHGEKWDMEVVVGDIPEDLRTAVTKECNTWTSEYNVDAPHLTPWNGKIVYTDPPVAVVFTDACNRGGGLWVEGDELHPPLNVTWPWVGSEIHAHITYQETAAAADGIVHTVEERRYQHCTVAVKVDATTAVKYIQCKGGKKLECARRVWSMMKVLRKRRVYVGDDKTFESFHVKGEVNPSDVPSRRALGMSEWALNDGVFKAIEQKWGPFCLDAFAAAWNTKHHRYLCRQRWDKAAAGHDALMHPYQNETGVVWAFPPPMRRVQLRFLSMIRDAQADAVVLLPLWPTEELALALSMATDVPIMLQCNETLLDPPQAYVEHEHRQEFSGWRKQAQWWIRPVWKNMIGVRLSGRNSCAEAFRESWRKQCLCDSKLTNVEKGAHILIELGKCFGPISEKHAKLASVVSQMLISSTAQQRKITVKLTDSECCQGCEPC